MVDSVANLELIAELIDDVESSELLLEIVEARRERIEDLSWLLLTHEAEPHRGISQNFTVHRAWVRFIRHLLNPPDHQLVSECAKSDRALARIVTSHRSKVRGPSARMLQGLAEELKADAELQDRLADIVRSHGPQPTRRLRPSVWLDTGRVSDGDGGRGDEVQAA